MTLTQDLARQLAQNLKQMPQEVKAVMQQASTDLIQSGIAAQSLKAGDRLPPITLPNATGETVAVPDLLAQGPVVIAFYRGGWCPYCNLELRALQQYLSQIKAAGASLVAISPETPDNSLSTAEQHNLTFEVLSDVGNGIARSLGLVFTVPENLRPIYQNFGIDLLASNGDDSFELPLPATYIVGQDGVILHAFVDADYTKRLDPEEIVAILQRQAA